MRARRLRRLGLLAAIVAAGVLWWLGGRGAGAGERGGWVEVRRDDLVVGVEVAGTLAAVDSALVGPPPVEGMWNQTIAYLAPEGAQVQKGAPVARFDSGELQRKLLDKLAEQASAEKELEKKQVNLTIERRDDELHLAEAEAKLRKSSLKVDVPPELVAANELRQSRGDLALSQREIAYLKERLQFERQEGEAELGLLVERRDRAAARVAEMRQQIARMTVSAPRDGTVVYVPDRRGEKRKVGDSVWQSDKVIEIPDLRRMRADAQVDEADAGRIAAGQAVRLRLDAHPEITFSGRVRAISGNVHARSDNNLQKVVELDLELERTDPQRMRPGMRFRGIVETARVRALVVPAEAVLATAEGPLVYRRVFFGAEPVRPRLGRRSATEVEVLSGLAAGDRLARRPESFAEGSGGETAPARAGAGP
ncbi:MAG TPA: HlyD family efflux transporter periplasmic adaptor subunit [Thermoanaerobaculia bacterium]|nr:HlyD family efflux transporter periplasmic adaptor subunit [Thermoanaerobaculia bacterium]